MLRKIWETLLSLAERLHNVCKKAVKVKNIILIQRPYSRKPFCSHSKEIIIFPRCYIYKVKDIYCSRKENLRKVAIAHLIMRWCYQFVRSSNHKITCFGWCSVRIGTLAIIILDFEKYASVSTIEFTDTLSEEESMKCFLQFIANNFDHNEDTTGACTTCHGFDILKVS